MELEDWERTAIVVLVIFGVGIAIVLATLGYLHGLGLLP
jgi:hypothetical protein